jgi:hypothetical protein
MTRDEVATKARNLMEPILGSAVCKHLIEKVLDLEKTKDIREIRPLLSTKNRPRDSTWALSGRGMASVPSL